MFYGIKILWGRGMIEGESEKAPLASNNEKSWETLLNQQTFSVLVAWIFCAI